VWVFRRIQYDVISLIDSDRASGDDSLASLIAIDDVNGTISAFCRNLGKLILDLSKIILN